MSRPTSINFDCVASRYDATRGGEQRGEQFARDLAPLLVPERPVLEVGVGTGVIAKALCGLGFRVYGADISENMLARARERLGNVVVRGDAMALPVGDETLDQALSVWVLHVVGDVGAVMDEVRRVLRPGATYLVMDGHKSDEEADEVQRAWDEIDAGLGRPSFAGRIRDYADVATSRALHVEDVITTGPYPYHTTVAETIMRIETKANSWMWNVSDDEWERVVTPVLERLRALPEPNRELPRTDYQDVLVLRK